MPKVLYFIIIVIKQWCSVEKQKLINYDPHAHHTQVIRTLWTLFFPN